MAKGRIRAVKGYFSTAFKQFPPAVFLPDYAKDRFEACEKVACISVDDPDALVEQMAKDLLQFQVGEWEDTCPEVQQDYLNAARFILECRGIIPARRRRRPSTPEAER